MKITENSHPMLIIEDVPGLDPIRVIIQNEPDRPGAGRIIVTCWDRAWHGYWGAMGGSLEKFFVSSHAEYLYGNLASGYCGSLLAQKRKSDQVYVCRIIEAVQHALRERAAAPAEVVHG